MHSQLKNSSVATASAGSLSGRIFQVCNSAVCLILLLLNIYIFKAEEQANKSTITRCCKTQEATIWIWNYPYSSGKLFLNTWKKFHQEQTKMLCLGRWEAETICDGGKISGQQHVKDLMIAGNHELNVLGYMKRTAVLEKQLFSCLCFTCGTASSFWCHVLLQMKRKQKIQEEQSEHRALGSMKHEEMLNFKLGLFISGRRRLKEKLNSRLPVYVCVQVHIYIYVYMCVYVYTYIYKMKISDSYKQGSGTLFSLISERLTSRNHLILVLNVRVRRVGTNASCWLFFFLFQKSQTVPVGRPWLCFRAGSSFHEVLYSLTFLLRKKCKNVLISRVSILTLLWLYARNCLILYSYIAHHKNVNIYSLLPSSALKILQYFSS